MARLTGYPLHDGVIHRFRVPSDKPGALNGWYVLYLDGIASGAFGSWKVGEVHRWSIRKPTDPLETQLIAQRIDRPSASEKPSYRNAGWMLRNGQTAGGMNHGLPILSTLISFVSR